MSESLRNPKEAAEFVWSRIESENWLTDWDLLCFSVMFLATMSQSPTYSYLQPAAKDAGRLLWTAFEHFNAQQPATSEPEGDRPRTLFSGDESERRSG